MKLPKCKYLTLEPRDQVLHITMNRPERKNAMSTAMAGELMYVFAFLKKDESVRAIVLRGAGGNFCSGEDINDLAQAGAGQDMSSDSPAYVNRRFGRLIHAANNAPQAVIAILEGAVLGGGLGLACISDVAIAHAEAVFGLPETGLGIPPAQIAPFVVQRIGLTQARRLGVCGTRFDGNEAARLGFVHFVCHGEDEIQSRLKKTLTQIRRCAPHANAVTKHFMLHAKPDNLVGVLDEAAEAVSDAMNGPEGSEGTKAFLEKRQPSWATDGDG